MRVNVNVSVCKDISEDEKKEYIDRFRKIYNEIIDIVRRDIDVYRFVCRKALSSLIGYLLYVLRMIDDIDTKNCVWEPYTSSRISSIRYHVDERIRDLKHFKCIEG